MEDRRHLGLLVPSSDYVMEADLWRRLSTDVVLHVARMYLESTTVEGEEKMLLEELGPAARRLSSVKPELAIFGCTSAAAIHGLDGDAEIARQVSEATGCRCITVVQAALEEIRRFKTKSLFLVTPYVDELTKRLMETLKEAGLPVIGAEGLGLDDDLAIGKVQPDEIMEYVINSVRQQAKTKPDSVFISCTTFRAFEVAKQLEKELEIPVFTSNRSVFNVIQRYLNKNG